MTTFEEIIQDEKLLHAIRDFGFTELTEIQEKTIPPGLQGKDLIGQAKTGSGKTIAFGIPILHGLGPERKPQALVLAPTRELCQQIAVELGKLGRHSRVKIAAVFGGVSINPQISDLRDAQIVIATPGRLLDHLERGTFNTASIRFLVFDEADRMFDMGFIKDMEKITRQLPKQRQTMLFSATMPDEIRRLAAHHQHDPVHIKTHTHVEDHLLPQFFYRVSQQEKFSLLVHLLKLENPNLAIIFCPTKHGAKSLARNLAQQGFESDAMQGNLSQSQRDHVIAAFKAGKIRFLVATDVAARGLDIKHVTHVFNYNVPNKPEDYIHRIGRTARAGAAGKAITLISSDENQAWRDVLRLPNVHALELKAENVAPISFQKGERGPRPTRGPPRSGTGHAGSHGDHRPRPSGSHPHYSGGQRHDGPRQERPRSEGRQGDGSRQGDGDRPRRRFPPRRFMRR